MSALTEAVARLWRWWIGELLGLLPSALRTSYGRGRARLELRLDGAEARLAAVRGRETRSLGNLILDDTPARILRARIRRLVEEAGLKGVPVSLVIPRGQALRKIVDLPAAAAENLREVVSFEMDRHTPFKAAEVYFDSRDTGLGQRPGRIDVDLAVVPRTVADGALALARELGLEPGRMTIEGDEAGALDLLAAAAPAAAGGWSRPVTVVLALCALGLLLFVAYLPLWRMQDELAATEDLLTRARAEAQEVEALRQKLDSTLRLNAFLVQRKAERPTVTEVMDEVTRLLPDNTWLAQLTLRDRALSLTGYSAKASALIAELERSRLLSGVSFSAPVTIDQRLATERFNLTATVGNQEPPR